MLSVVFLAALSSCTDSNKTTESTVISTDTVGAETQYDVEKKVVEKTVDVDTVTKDQTITRDVDPDSVNNN